MAAKSGAAAVIARHSAEMLRPAICASGSKARTESFTLDQIELDTSGPAVTRPMTDSGMNSILRLTFAYDSNRG
jgi:hypothetical protein